MHDPNPLAFMKLPMALLTLLANRSFHDSLQPLHHLIRLAHVLSAAAFFGAVAMLDLRLLRRHGTLPLGALARHAHPWLYCSFALAMASGVLLFFYDPIGVGSHAYFTPKLLLILLAFGNALRLHRSGLGDIVTAATLPRRARVAGLVSLAVWVGVIACSSLNQEAAPRVPLW